MYYKIKFITVDNWEILEVVESIPALKHLPYQQIKDHIGEWTKEYWINYPLYKVAYSKDGIVNGLIERHMLKTFIDKLD